MFRTSLELNYLKRPLRPLYGWTQATPKAGYLDPSWTRSVAIYPGMVMTKTVGNNYTLIGSAAATNTAQQPAGLCANFIGGAGIDELLESGVNALAVWELGPDAEFELLNLGPANTAGYGAFDASQSWTSIDTNSGTDVLLYASVAGANQGQLVPRAYGGTKSADAVARLIQVESPNSIIIGGLKVRSGAVA